MGQQYKENVEKPEVMVETFFSMLKAQKEKGTMGCPVDLYEHNV